MENFTWITHNQCVKIEKVKSVFVWGLGEDSMLLWMFISTVERNFAFLLLPCKIEILLLREKNHFIFVTFFFFRSKRCCTKQIKGRLCGKLGKISSVIWNPKTTFQDWMTIGTVICSEWATAPTSTTATRGTLPPQTQWSLLLLHPNKYNYY